MRVQCHLHPGPCGPHGCLPSYLLPRPLCWAGLTPKFQFLLSGRPQALTWLWAYQRSSGQTQTASWILCHLAVQTRYVPLAPGFPERSLWQLWSPIARMQMPEPRSPREPTEPLCESVTKCWSLSHVPLSVTPWTVAHQAPLSMGFSEPL